MEKLQLDSDLEPRLVHVPYKGMDYVLMEASTGAAIKYRNRNAQGLQLNDEGKAVGYVGTADAEAMILSMCLYRADNVDGVPQLKMNSNGDMPDSTRLVPEPVIRSWPNRVTQPMFEKLEDISDLASGGKLSSLRKQADKIARRIKLLEDEESVTKNSSGATAAT